MTFALLVLLSVGPASPHRDNPEFDAAARAWQEQRWSDAAAALARAYALDPRPEYVFGRAQALRKGGDCPAAIEVYREFIDLDPPADAIEEARLYIRECGGAPEVAPAPAPVTIEPPRVTPAIPEPVRPPAPPLRRWWRDPAGHVLAWTGVAAAAVGGGVVGEGLSRRARGERAGDEQAYRDARRGGATLLHAGIPLLSVGGVLVLASIVRFGVVARMRADRRDRARASTATATIDPWRGLLVRW